VANNVQLEVMIAQIVTEELSRYKEESATKIDF
jgi:hypothetical protein